MVLYCFSISYIVSMKDFLGFCISGTGTGFCVGGTGGGIGGRCVCSTTALPQPYLNQKSQPRPLLYGSCVGPPFSRSRAANPKLPTLKIFIKVSQNSYFGLFSRPNFLSHFFDRNKYVLQVFIVNCYRIPKKFFI